MKKLTRSLEDYMEAIYFIENRNGFSRVNEIGKFLNVKMPSVNAALKELSRKELIIHKKYGYIKLTENGRKLAENISSVHNSLVELFILLGFDDESSFKYGCYLEHIINEKDKFKIIKVIETIKKGKKYGNDAFKSSF